MTPTANRHAAQIVDRPSPEWQRCAAEHDAVSSLAPGAMTSPTFSVPKPDDVRMTTLYRGIDAGCRAAGWLQQRPQSRS